MAIIGGAGNPVGGSFTGPAEALEIVGDHALAMSGIVQAGASQGTADNLLSFTTGNYYFVGTIQFFYATDTNESDDFLYKVSLNDSIVMQYLVTGTSSNAWADGIELIIPSYTEVIASATNIAASSAKGQCAVMAGRIYRTRD